MSKISIITTTYKHQDFITETIESVLAQTYTDRELLIGDDSPDDATRDIIQGFIQKYPDKIKARHHCPNKGIVDNMNFLINQTSKTSEFIAFLEGDDIYIPTNIEKKINIFSSNLNIAVVYSDISVVNEDTKIVIESGFKKAKSSFFQNEIPGGFFTIMSYSTRMIKKSILLEAGGIPKVPGIKDSNSDQLLGFLVGKKFMVYGINEPLTLYRRHGNNISSNYYVMIESFLGQIDYLYKEGKINKKIYKQMKQKTLLDLVSIYLMDKKWCKALSIFRDSQGLGFVLSNVKLIIITTILLLMPKFLSSFLLKLYKKYFSFFN